MKPESLLKLAKLAYKSNEEAKSAEAHARACKVYAKQVCKESCAAGSIALDTLRLAKNSLCELISDLNINTAEDASIELMETLVKLSKDSDPIISPSMLKAVMEYDSSEKNADKRSNLWQNLQMNEQQMFRMEDILGISEANTSYAEDDSILFQRSLNCPSEEESYLSFERSAILTPALLSYQQSLHSTATKRKTKRSSKTRAVGFPSPLLSMEEVTIVKRSTSPNTSQHSGIVGAQHKYSVRRKHSVTSQPTETDEEERALSPMPSATQSPPKSPLAREDRSGSPDLY